MAISEQIEVFTNDYGIEMERKTVVETFEDGTEKVIGVLEYPKPSNEPVEPEPVEPEPTEAELIQAQILLNQADILAR